MQLLARDVADDATLPRFCRARVLVLGCGNVLFGDDGFGPAVVEWLENNCKERIPDDVCVLDAGTGVRTILFTLTLSDRKPAKLIIVDAVDIGKTPGDVFALGIDDLPFRKIDDFSMHQLPTSNLLKELQQMCEVDVRIVACQVERIPNEISSGLSAPLQQAVPKACEAILEDLKGHA